MPFIACNGGADIALLHPLSVYIARQAAATCASRVSNGSPATWPHLERKAARLDDLGEGGISDGRERDYDGASYSIGVGGVRGRQSGRRSCFCTAPAARLPLLPPLFCSALSLLQLLPALSRRAFLRRLSLHIFWAFTDIHLVSLSALLPWGELLRLPHMAWAEWKEGLGWEVALGGGGLT